MKLLEPGKIGKLSVKNRIVMAPMSIGVLAEREGTLGQRALDYYVARAKGGVGLITLCGVRVAHVWEPHTGSRLWIRGPADLVWLKKVADTLHDCGAKVAVQFSPGVGRVANPHDARSLVHDEVVAPSASPCFFDPSITARALTIDEIERVTQAWETGASMIRNAGIDAIQVQGHEGYLLDQFMTALWNQRSDKYGGDLAGRMRFSIELIEAIKRGAGADFPVIYRFGLEHHLPGGREIPEGLEIARRLEAAGADALDIDAGCYETAWWSYPTQYQPPACMIDMAEKAKKVVSIPVMSIGKLGYPDLAERILQEGKADFISLGRPLLADPDWPRKVEEGRFEDIRPCLCDHDGCSARTKEGKYLSCTVNPATGMEREYALAPAVKRKNVLVVGAGPGGMEAAMIAAQRGHKTTLWEKGHALGGNLVPASAPDFKQDYRKLIDYFSIQLRKLGVTIELGKEATPELIQSMKPDVVFVATGSTPIVPKIPGIDRGHVITATDYLMGKRKVGQSVIMVGGGLVGCETALDLVRKGKKVTIVELLHEVASDMFWRNRNHLLHLLAAANVTILTDTKVVEITAKGLVAADRADKRRRLEADTVMLAAGYIPNRLLFEAVKDKVPEVYAVGDCVQPRKIIDAIWEGFGAARVA